MKNNDIRDVQTYSFSSKDNLFLDTNIWIYIYGPIPNKNDLTDIYSKTLDKIRNAFSKIFINELILSEFINTYARLEYNQLSKEIKPSEFKKYRASSLFKLVAEDIYRSTKRIINRCNQCNSNFEKADIEKVLFAFSKGDKDFNDQIFSEICKKNHLIMITDDLDFRNYDIPILTANKKLLSIV